MKNAVFWDVVPCRSCVNRRFGGTYRHHFQGIKIRVRRISVSRLQPPAHAGSSHADFSTLKIEAISSSETSVHTRPTRRHIPEDGILHHTINLLTVLFLYLLFIFLKRIPCFSIYIYIYTVNSDIPRIS
jgi:hypothetical protein